MAARELDLGLKVESSKFENTRQSRLRFDKQYHRPIIIIRPDKSARQKLTSLAWSASVAHSVVKSIGLTNGTFADQFVTARVL